MAKSEFLNLENVYRISGDDLFLIKNTVNKIEKACELNFPDLNKSVFDNENFNADAVCLSCQQIPMMDKKRLVIVKNIQKLKESDISKLVEYAKNPIEETVLILEEMVGANIFSKVPAEKIVCNKLTETKLKDYIVKELESSGKTINEEAVSALIEFCSRDMLRIQNELFKLKFIKSSNIDFEIIKKYVNKNDDYSIFEISTALTYGQGDKAINLIHKMLESLEFPVILGLISSHFRRMLYSVISEGSEEEIATKLGVKSFAVKRAKTLAKNLSSKQIVDICNLILEIDYGIKSGKMNIENSLYFMVFSIINIVKGAKK